MIKKFIINIIKYLCKFSLPYFLLHIVLWLKLNKRNDVEDNFKKFVDDISEIKKYDINNKKIYIILEWAAWDAAYYFLPLKYLLYYLYDKTNNIFIVWNTKYIDIYKLFLCFFPELKILWIKDLCAFDMSIAEIKKTLDIDDSDIIINYREQSLSQWMFKIYWSYFQCCSALKQIFIDVFDLNWIIINPIKSYNYDNLDYEKIDKILSYYNNPDWLIICNFENRSYKLARKDSIKFKDYLNNIKEISKKSDIKFVINSVYDNENLYKDDNVIVARLNFQEIIWLSEHNKIKLFISERNWLNDVFKVFFPDVNQIIYYPNYYYPCVDKKIYQKFFKKQLNKADVKDCWHLPWENIIEDIRWNFYSTIEKYLEQLIHTSNVKS